MSIIIRSIIGALQDTDGDSYHRVVQVYPALTAGFTVVGAAILISSLVPENVAQLQCI